MGVPECEGRAGPYASRQTLSRGNGVVPSTTSPSRCKYPVENKQSHAGESYQRATTQGPIRVRGFTRISRAGNPKRKRPNCHNKTPRCRGVGTPSWTGPLTTSLRGLWVSGYLPPDNGGPCERAATRKPTKQPRGLTQNSRAGNPKRTRPKLPTDRILSNQRGLQRTKRGGDPKTPLCEGKGPENPGVVAPFAVADCRGNRMRAVVCSSTRWARSLLYLCSEVPQARYIVDGRVSADNCGGSAVAWGPCGQSAGAVLGQV